MTTRRFSGEYADDGKAQRLRVRTEAGHRCIRCGHPFESGKHGRGEWSPCDEHCTHKGPIRKLVPRQPPEEGIWIQIFSNCTAGELYDHGAEEIQAQWRVLTVHHLDGQKDNDAWWNTLALCQRCHLQIQTTLDPRVPWFLPHSEWFKPYAAGFYAHKYEGKMITREEAAERMDELLAYELRA